MSSSKVVPHKQGEQDGQRYDGNGDRVDEDCFLWQICVVWCTILAIEPSFGRLHETRDTSRRCHAKDYQSKIGVDWNEALPVGYCRFITAQQHQERNESHYELEIKKDKGLESPTHFACHIRTN